MVLVGRCKWILVIVLLLVIQGNVFAKGTVYFTEHYQFEKDTYINYKLEVSDKSEIAGLTVTIQYDSKQLKLDETKVGETLKSTINKINNKVEGTVIVTAISTDEITNSGSIINLKFEVLNGSKEYIDIQCSIDECINQNCEEILNTVTTEKIKNPLFKPNESNTEIVEDNKKDSNTASNNLDKKEVASGEQSENEQKNDRVHIEESVDDKEKKQEDPIKTDGSLKKEVKKSESKSKNAYIFAALITGGAAILTLSIMIARRRRK